MNGHAIENERRLVEKWASDNGRWLIEVGAGIVSRLLEGKALLPEDANRLIGPGVDVVQRFGELGYQLELDESGAIVGAGLSLIPDRYAMDMDGYRCYGWCAMDALMFPIVLKKPMVITAQCPATQRLISLTVSQDGIEEVTPAGTAMSLAPPEGPDLREAFCKRTNLFASTEAAAGYTAHDPEVAVITLEEGFQTAGKLAGHF